mgnify:CR=1 FL=1
MEEKRWYAVHTYSGYENKVKTNLEKIESALLEYWEELPPRFITSSEKGIGRDEVLNYIENILQTV